MGGELRARLLVMMVLGAAPLGGAACGGSGGRDGGAARDGGRTGDGAQCPPAEEPMGEPAPRPATFDGGVPIDQLSHLLAVARCNYISRCFALSTYLANECVDILTSSYSWAYQSCVYRPTLGFICTWTGSQYSFPSFALPSAVAAGVVQYDAQKEGQCLTALLTEGCAGRDLLENIPACAGVFTCASGGDGGAGPTDAGASDGGSACAQLLPPMGEILHTCSTDEDCVGVTGTKQGPDCVDGICSATRCGISFSGCISFAAAGESCNSNTISPLNSSISAAPEGICGPGLACQGVAADGGLGTCVVPVDVGGTCTDDTNCKPGLTCACGTCEIPPSTGPCVNGLCEVGVAYCDLDSNVCRPVRAFGASCADAANSCGPGLICNGSLCAGLP